MKILPFVNSVPNDGQQRIQWIRNGDALMGASTKFGSDGNLNIATAQVQANVVVLDENLQELNLGFDANTQKIQEIEALLEASGSLDLVQTVQTNTTDIEQLKLDSTETKSRLTSVETETNANKTMLGDTGPNFVGTVNSEIEFLKARIGNNINETVNGTPNQGAPATGVKLSINNIIAELNSVKQSNTELNNKVDLYDVPTLKSGITQIRTELGPTPVSKPPVYTMLDSLTNDSSTFSTDIETIKSKIAFNNPNSIDARVGSLENDYLTLENTVNGPDGLTTHMSVVESEIDLLNPAVDTLQTQVANIDTSLSGADGLSQQVQEIKAHVGIVPNGEVAPPTSLEGRFVTLKDMQNDTSSTVQDLQVDVLDLRTDVDKKASIDQLNAIGAGHKAYLTLAAAQAAQASLPVNTLVEVTNDPTSSNNGTYQWNGTTLTKSVYDPLTQAKSYTDTFFTNYDTSALLTVQNMFIQKTTGTVASGASFNCSDFISIIGGKSYDIYSYVTGNARHAWYDENKVFISAFGEDQTALSLKTYTAPDNARYMRVSAYTTAKAVAYLKSSEYQIDKVKKIIEQHTPFTPSKFSLYGASNVSDTLDAVIIKQNTIISNQNNIISQLDLISDKESPCFVNTSQFVKAVLTPSNFNAVNVTARISDTQMTVSDVTAFIYSGSCVVYDSTANTYTSHNVIGINGTTITVMPPLPLNPTQVQTMHDSALGQHLTLFGYKGLADHLLNTVQKYGYKKSENLVFNFNPTKYMKQTASLGQITTDGTTVVIPVTLIGTAKTGGYVAGTTNLIKACDLVGSNLNIGNNAHTQYLTKAYNLTDAIAGNGFEISFNAQNSDGFIEIPLAVRDESYISSSDSQTYKTSGKARLQVFNGSTSIHDAVYAAGQVHHVFIDFAAAETLKVRVTCETSVPTSILLSGIFAYKKSAKTSKDYLFKDGDVVAFLGDSWTQYPIATTIGETGQTRPDGSVSTGSQWLSRRMKEKLLALGKNVTMLNMGFGGQTSRWGKYWVNTIINLDPKPTHCVLCFYINDNNGINNSAATAYDFDPINMFVNKTVANGGISGRVQTYDEWESNMKLLCEKLIANGIKPIVIMPSQTASTSQAQAIRSGQLDRLTDGFGG